MQNRVIGLIFFTVLMGLNGSLYAATLKIATIAPEGTTWMQVMREGANEIKQQTEGRVQIKFYPGGAMGSDKNVLRKINIGQLQGGAVTGGALASVYPDAQIYSLPLQFSNHEQVKYVRRQMDEFLRKEIENSGFVNLGMSEGGFAYLFSKAPVHKLSDLQGMRVWIPENDMIGQAVLEALGVSPVPLPISDVLTALQTGLLDVVAVSTTGAIAFQWHTKLKYMLDSPMVLTMGMLVVSKKSFDKLSAVDQKIVRQVMLEKFASLDELNAKDNISSRQALMANGVKFITPTEDEKGAWKTVADQALKTLKDKSAFSKDAYDRLQKHLQAFTRLNAAN